MDNLVNAAAGLDLAKMIGALNPNEFEALQRYAPLFLEDAQREIAEADVTVKVSNTAYEVTGSGDTRHVGVKAFQVEATAEGDTATFELKDGCLLLTAEDETVNTCEDLGELPDLETSGIDPAQLEDLQATAKEVFSDYTNPGFTVQRVGGSWFVSPMATGFDQLFAVSKALTRDEIEELVDHVEMFIESVEENGGFDEVPLPGLPDYTRPGADDEPTATTIEPDDATVTTTETSDDADPGNRCFSEDDAQAAADCFASLVRRGELEQSEVPWWLQHSECGATDAYWSGEYYNLADDEFVALIDKAAPCYQAVVASGNISADVLPPEITDPACLEGHNPYNGDDELLDAFYDCAFG